MKEACEKLIETFARFGMPSIITADNGRAFIFEELK